MGLIRTQMSALMKSMLLHEGIHLVKPTLHYGFQGFADVNHLSRIWNRPIKLVFDVGANDGETALSALTTFTQARIFSFEPHPQTFTQLVARVGSHLRFRAVNLALSDDTGEAEMFEYDESNLNSLVPNAQYARRFSKSGRHLRVPVTTIDTFCAENQIDSIDLLKIDTEGFDLVVLQGCQELLRKKAIHFVYVEFNDLQPSNGVFGGALVPVDDLLRPHGFRFVASYTDYIDTSGEMFSVSNALFALPPL